MILVSRGMHSFIQLGFWLKEKVFDVVTELVFIRARILMALTLLVSRLVYNLSISQWLLLIFKFLSVKVQTQAPYFN